MIYDILACLLLVCQVNAQVRRKPAESHSTLNYRWFNEFSDKDNVFNRNDTKTDQILHRVFNQHIDGFPYCSEISKPLDVDLVLIVLAMLGVDEPTKEIQLSVRFVMSWTHCRLRWNASEYGNISVVEVPRSIAVWTPDVTWIERPEKDFAWRTQSRLILSSDGQLSMNGQAIINYACSNMHFTMFPFDAHKCQLTFLSLSHEGNELRLSVSMMTTKDFEDNTRHIESGNMSPNLRRLMGVLISEMLDDSLDTEQWVVRLEEDNICDRDTFHFDEVKQNESTGSLIQYSEATCSVYLRRHPLYHMFSLFTPASLITFLTVFAFIIPPSEVDSKIGFALTIMLQLLVFMMYVYQRLPVASTQIPLLTQFFSFCIAIVALSVLMTVIIAHVSWLGDDQVAVPRIIDTLFIRLFGRLLVKPHLKVLRKWEAHVVRKQTGSARPFPQPSINRVDPLPVNEQETCFISHSPLPRAASVYDNVSRKPSVADKQAQEHMLAADSDEQVHLRVAAANLSRRQHCVRSVSQIAEAASECADDRTSLVRARWALVSLVIDKLCFYTFFFSILTCVVYHTVVGYQFWLSFNSYLAR